MSGFGSKQVKGSNCNELLPNPDGSLNANITTAPGAGVPNIYMWEKMLDGGSREMAVDGTVPKTFLFAPAGGVVCDLASIMLTIIDPGSMEDLDFGSIPGPLTNGLLLETKVNGTGPHTNLILFDNADLSTHFKKMAGDEGDHGFMDERDQFKGIITFEDPITLIGSKGDFVRWTVQDDLQDLKLLRSTAKLLKNV